jgi:hypothetical protein
MIARKKAKNKKNIPDPEKKRMRGNQEGFDCRIEMIQFSEFDLFRLRRKISSFFNCEHRQ